MSKYIIDIPNGVEWGVVTCRTEDGFYTRDFDSLEELNADYINEHFGDLQDTAYRKGRESVFHELEISGSQKGESADDAYQRGFEDGKTVNDKGCEGCMYANVAGTHEPCVRCSNSYSNQWTAKDDKIEVGDEVNWMGDCFIVTRIFQPRTQKEQCDGIDDDGCVYHDVLMDDLEKTGRHFDIASILEDMRK